MSLPPLEEGCCICRVGVALGLSCSAVRLEGYDGCLHAFAAVRTLSEAKRRMRACSRERASPPTKTLPLGREGSMFIVLMHQQIIEQTQ